MINYNLNPPDYYEDDTCPYCDGTGTYFDEPCSCSDGRASQSDIREFRATEKENEAEARWEAKAER